MDLTSHSTIRMILFPFYQHSDGDLIEWANSLLPKQYRIYDVTRDLTSGLVLLRLAESIKGSPSEPPVSDSLFKDENNIDGMFKLFDYLLDNDVYVSRSSPFIPH